MAKYSLIAKEIFDWLKQNADGRDNAKPMRLLCGHYAIDRREVEQAIEELREAGEPICSACAKPMGLYVAKNYNEMLPWVKQIENRFKKMAIHRASAIKRLKEQAGREGLQLELEFA